MTDFETFKLYLALKNHFSKKSYDYFKYNGKVTAKLESFYKRKDRFFFEKLAHTKERDELVNYFVSNYVELKNVKGVWVGDLKLVGEKNYQNWIHRIQNLPEVFTAELKLLTEKQNLLEAIKSEKNKHPLIFKQYLSNQICIETFIILDDLLKVTQNFDDQDIIWRESKMLIEKYRPFFSYDKRKYIEIIKTLCSIKS